MRDLLRRPVVVDGAVAVGLTAWNQWELSRAEFVDGAIVFNHLAFAVMTLSVALRRVAPLGCAAVAAAALTAQTLWGGDVFGAAAQFVALLVATHATGSHPDPARRWIGLVVTLVGVECILLIEDEIVVADEVGNVSVLVAVWALAAAVRVGEEHRQREVDEHERREREAIDQERARVARELHDIVAHGLSLMVLHAGAARAASPEAAPTVQQSLGVVEDAGRQALGELHRLLGMLSGGEEASDGMVGLGDVRELCNRMSTAGLEVELLLDPVQGADRSVELSAYRIVQEALTNSLRCGGGAVRVEIGERSGALEVLIRDRRSGPDRAATIRGEGRGLRGLRERVALFGGSFSAGPTAHGWEVHAELPLRVVT
ncbi:MAG: histidine kinase [Actinomycetota bacterium]|nr:hypothetical protein [Acidimicrobiia bacterium]MDQ3293449.1 histidine kinase [Actinomycetota bacterium]